MTIGIPNALLSHRYLTLWTAFFEGLGVNTVSSGPTSRKILEEGSVLAADEACLSLKIFFGHVKALAGSCDYIFVPRISNFGRRRELCVRFDALYDLTRNIFRDSGQKFLTYDLDVLSGQQEEAAFLEMEKTLGYSAKKIRKVYDAAKKAEQQAWKTAVRAQEQLYKADGLKILIVAHSYIITDSYIGQPIQEFIQGMGAIPIRADLTNREAALKRSQELSPTCKWEMSRELLGSIALHRDKVDGIILVSAFPCGPDAMVNELLVRRLDGVPVLNMVLDDQSGTAGIETRLESFIDIIRLKKGEL